MSLSTALSSQVSPATRGRGHEYFRSGAVTLDFVDRDEVQASVRGGTIYEVDLDLEGQTVSAYCSCPYLLEHGLVCKHIWATILAAEKRGFSVNAAAKGRLRLVVNEDNDLDGDEFDGEDFDRFDGGYDKYTPGAYRPRTHSPPPVRRDEWRQQLAALSSVVQPTESHQLTQPAERQLLFVVDLTACEQAKKLVIEVNSQQRKKNGEWGKLTAQPLNAAQVAALPDPGDRKILALLGGAERGDNYGFYSGYYGYDAPRFRIAGPILDAVLPLLAASGRLRLRRDAGPPPVLEEVVFDLDPPWRLVVTVTREKSGKKWVLEGNLRRGGKTMSLSAPTLVVPGLVFSEGRVTRFDDGGAFPWVSVLRRAGQIAVPVKRTDEFLELLLKLPVLPEVAWPEELRYTEEPVSPRPRLVVKKPRQTYGASVLHAELSFDYGGQYVPAGSPGRGFFRPEEKRFVLRDPVAEQNAAAQLTRLGVCPGWSWSGTVLQLKPAQLPKTARELAAAGWRVEAEGKLYRQAGEFKLAVRTERDWFDLRGSADFDGRPVPLPRLLEALRRGESSLVLDDGSLGIVPEEWLKKYGLLVRMGTVEGDTVRFGRAQVGVLDALLASRPEVTFDAQFARARDKLRKFAGVAAADPPNGFVGELRGYQREGLGWLHFLRDFGIGGCLADDMGLGKTVQVLALLAGKRTGPALVVVPRSLVFNWQQEAARFAPGLRVLDYTGAKRDQSGAAFADYDLVLTTYGTLRNDAAKFADFRFDTCVLDEAQAAKNAETETAKAVKLVNAEHRLALTGTPVENHLGELWTMFDFLNPGMLGRAAARGGPGSPRNPDAETREVLAQALRPFILRRTKDQVANDLPPKTEQTVYCDLDVKQRKLYDELRDHYRQSLLTRVDSVGLGRAKIQVLEALLRLRQAACHAGLLDKQRVTESSAKLDLLIPRVQELAEEGHKTLVFSQFTALLAIVRARLDAEGLPFEYLDGRTRDRAARVERFQTDPDCKLFLVSLKAGGVGLNLTAAEYVFLLDPWWNPAVEAQAIDRTHRIGQVKPVFAYRLITRGTVEEKVLELQQSKRELADAILGGNGNLIADLKREDLERLLS